MKKIRELNDTEKKEYFKIKQRECRKKQLKVNISWVETICTREELNWYLRKYPNTNYFIIDKQWQ